MICDICKKNEDTRGGICGECTGKITKKYKKNQQSRQSIIAVTVVFVILVVMISFFSSDAFNKITENTQESMSKIEIVQKQEPVNTITQKETHKETSNNLESLDERAEKSMFNYLNEKRAEKGIVKLSYSDTLATLANSNSKINADDNELKHTQVSRAFNCKVIGGKDTIGTAEVVTVDQGSNPIFYQTSPELVGKRLIDSWLESKTGHREALLDQSMHYVGFGVDTTLIDVYGTGELCP